MAEVPQGEVEATENSEKREKTATLPGCDRNWPW